MEKNSESIYIQIVSSDTIYEAEIISNDWAPGLVGRKLFENVVRVSNKKLRWVGGVSRAESRRIGKATLKIARSGILSTNLRPGGSAKWTRTDPIEKRY
ncbi:MAG: hypothetical protein ACJAQ6_001867 [Arenicella sp.]